MPKAKKVAESPKVVGIKKAELDTRKYGGATPELKDQFLAEMSEDGNVSKAVRRGVCECACCGKPITEGNGVKQPKRVFSSGYHPVCLPCQQRMYAEIAKKTSRTYALFYACVRFDLPYKPSVIEGMAANQNGVWHEYVKQLNRDSVESADETWCDGITEIADAFGGEFPVLPITGDVLVANMNEMTDRERWDIEWGEEMGDADCRNADDRFMMMTANRSGGTIPPIVSMYLHDAIRYMIARDKQHDSMEAKRYQEMIDKLMNSEAIKNWLSNKGETVQVDRVVRYLEAKNEMKNGYLLGRDDLVRAIANEHGNYSMSLDIVDSMMLCIINTMRKNNGESEFSKLPLTAQVSDTRGELTAEMGEDEKKILEGVGMKVPEREAQ